jgi:hypothetical protein
VGHTVAQVPLSEDIVKELFETGKTKQKVTGFISKAGKPFDACLKFENERIQFDFNNQGEISAPKPSEDNKDSKDSDGELPWLSQMAQDAMLYEQNLAESYVEEDGLPWN